MSKRTKGHRFRDLSASSLPRCGCAGSLFGEDCPPCDAQKLLTVGGSLDEFHGKGLNPALSPDGMLHMTCVKHPGHCLECQRSIDSDMLVRLIDEGDGGIAVEPVLTHE